jgi:hypothetical protein
MFCFTLQCKEGDDAALFNLWGSKPPDKLFMNKLLHFLFIYAMKFASDKRSDDNLV